MKSIDQRISLTGLRSRLLVLVLAALLPLSGLVIYTSIKSQQKSRADVSEALFATAKLAALHQERETAAARQLLAAIAGMPSFRKNDFSGCLEFFQRLRGLFPHYLDLGLLDLNGNNACNPVDKLAPGRAGDRSFFKEMLATKTFSRGEYMVDRQTGQSAITFGMPVLGARAETTSVAFATVALAKIVAHAPVDEPLAIDLLLVNRQGAILGGDKPDRDRLGTHLGDTVLNGALKMPPAKTFDAIDANGLARMYAAVAVGDDNRSGLYVVSSISRDAMTSLANRQFALTLALLFVLAAFGLMMSRWAGEKIILVPARRLLDQVRELTGVEAESQKGPASSPDEFVELSRAFYRMAGVMKARENERDNTELALQATQNRLLASQRIGKIGNWEFDIAANQVWWSDQTYEIYGLSPDASQAFVGTYENLLKQVFPPDREDFDIAQKTLFEGRGSLDIEHRIIKANGEVRWVHGLGESIVNTNGKTVMLSGTVQDITDRKRLDEAMRSSEAQFRLLTDAMPQIVWMMQADGRHTYFNQGWIDYSGLAMEESLGHGWTRLIHPDDSLPVSRHREQASGCGGVYEIEHRLRRADGAYRWMLSRAFPLGDEKGRKSQWLGTFTDIDDMKQAAALQEQGLSMLRIAGKVARLGGWTIELPERKLTWSDENCAIHDVPPGYQPTLAEGIGYFLPEHRATVTRFVDACQQHGTPYEFVLPKITAKGRRIWVRSIGEAVRDASGQIIRLQGAFQDISEQKQAQARMLALEDQLSTTLESITDGFFLLDKDWKFTFLNGPAERILKRCRKDLFGKSVWLEFSEIVGTRMEREYRMAVETQRTSHFEDFYLPLKIWFDFHVYPTEAGIAVYFQDITQRHSEQAQLRLLETAVSRLNDIVVITEAEPFKEQGPRIVFVNDAFERYTGYSREDAIGNTPRLLLGPKSQSADLDRIHAAMKKWHPVRAEIISYTKAGKELWLEIDIAPIADDTGRFTHWVAVKRDITERRRQQEEILSLNSELEERVQLRTSQMKVANQELESFSYSVSHDLRSPLNTIHAFSHLLLKAEGNNISPKGKHYLSRIIAGARQMGELIEGLLTLAHLSRGQFKSEHVDLSEIARRIEQDYREREPERQTQAHVHIQDGLSARGDPRLLSAVFENLVGNAWKFTSRQDLARIDVGSETDANGDTVFFVRDNGAGFDMAFAHKLFGTFERLHSPEEFAGSGIGLATVKRVIERHGGRVWAESRLNEGATFYFTLGRMIESVT